MQNNIAAKFTPIVSDEKKIDVSLADNEAIIKLSTWTEDLGWTCQKTLQVDVEMLDDLHRTITSARYKLKKQETVDSEQSNSSKVLEFPSFS